jgi:hypothetical protein
MRFCAVQNILLLYSCAEEELSRKVVARALHELNVVKPCSYCILAAFYVSRALNMRFSHTFQEALLEVYVLPCMRHEILSVSSS